LQVWALVHFENERSLFFLIKNVPFGKFLIFALSLLLKLNDRSFFSEFRSFFYLKEQKSDSSFCTSLEKSNEKSDRSFTLFKRVTKIAIALSFFCKEQQKERLIIRSF